jgi:hypothetical protein
MNGWDGGGRRNENNDNAGANDESETMREEE